MLIVIACLVIFVVVILIAMLIKLGLEVVTPEKLQAKYANDSERSNIFVKKYKEADMNYYSGTFMRLGLILTMLLLLGAFSYAPRDKKDNSRYELAEEEEMEIEPPPTNQNQPTSATSATTTSTN